jgi:dipeptidase D
LESAQHVLTIFERLSAIPRGSGHEEQVSLWLQGLANQYGFPCQVDQVGNLVIRVPATPGRENAPVIVLQGHMDMVCEKTPESNHDFLHDPIKCIVDGDWLHADHTTLGADNGIAIALVLALVADSSVVHPPLELLFTVQEEVGLGGVNHLKSGFITGKILVNLDSEDEGTFIVGCAGGQTTRINLPVQLADTEQTAAFQLVVGGLRGGHSGVDIHKHYASANKLLARTLNRLLQETPLDLMQISGGTAHNAISREAWASFVCAAEKTGLLKQALSEFLSVLNKEFSPVEKDITLTLSPIEPGRAASTADTARIIQLLMALPHGVAAMSASVPGFVETSNNLAHIDFQDSTLKIVTSQRSNVMTRMEELTERITAIGKLAGAEVSSTQAYPGWQPDMQSPLLQRSIETYQSVFGRKPEVSLIHAGLECGTIGAIYPSMDMVSLGVTIENPHSPLERMNIPSIERVWKYLVAFLQTYR